MRSSIADVFPPPSLSSSASSSPPSSPSHSPRLRPSTPGGSSSRQLMPDSPRDSLTKKFAEKINKEMNIERHNKEAGMERMNMELNFERGLHERPSSAGAILPSTSSEPPSPSMMSQHRRTIRRSSTTGEEVIVRRRSSSTSPRRRLSLNLYIKNSSPTSLSTLSSSKDDPCGAAALLISDDEGEEGEEEEEEEITASSDDLESRNTNDQEDGRTVAGSVSSECPIPMPIRSAPTMLSTSAALLVSSLDCDYVPPVTPRAGRVGSVSYLRPHELPASKDEDTAKYGREAMLSAYDVLSSEAKTVQGLLDPQMVLLRALFDVPACGEYKQLAGWIITVFESYTKSNSLLQWAIRQEVQNTTSPNTLFREDSMPGALASHFLKTSGKSFMQRVIAPPIAKMLHARDCYEIDLDKAGGAKSNEKRLRKLVALLLKRVFESVPSCPAAIRDFVFYMSSEIRDRFPSNVVAKTVSSFYFLHFVCPFIVYPDQLAEHVDTHRPPTREAQRGLILAAKVIQNIANGGENIYTEAHLGKLNKFVADYCPKLERFMEEMANKTIAPCKIISEYNPSSQQQKLAMEELQKYMAQKLKVLPVNPTPEDNTKNMPVLRLRRALQIYAKCNLTRSTSSPTGTPRFYTMTNNNMYSFLERFSPKRRTVVDT